jgi:hypothetical protein
MGRYAEGTDVPVDRSRSEIERVLQRYGASGFGYSWERREVPIDPIPAHGPKREQRDFVALGFTFKDRRIRLDVPMPTEREAGSQSRMEAATRQRWRAMLLVIKAKLEAVASGISTLEHEFLANLVTDDGRTIGEVIVPRLTEAVAAGRLLPAKGSE